MAPRSLALALPLSLASALALVGCALYFSDDGGGGTGEDAGPQPVDTSPVPECDVTQAAGLRGFRSCMDFEGWEAAGLCDFSNLALLDQSTGQRRPCYTCHASAQNGAHIERDCEATYQAMQTWPIQNHLIAPVEDEDGCFAGFTSGKICGDGVSEEHLPFRCANALSQSLEDYIASTYAAWRDGTCD